MDIKIVFWVFLVAITLRLPTLDTAMAGFAYSGELFTKAGVGTNHRVGYQARSYVPRERVSPKDFNQLRDVPERRWEHLNVYWRTEGAVSTRSMRARVLIRRFQRYFVQLKKRRSSSLEYLIESLSNTLDPPHSIVAKSHLQTNTSTKTSSKQGTKAMVQDGKVVVSRWSCGRYNATNQGRPIPRNNARGNGITGNVEVKPKEA
ncbi:hypothetical protein Tco_1148872 [Tanacetum coccineum]